MEKEKIKKISETEILFRNEKYIFSKSLKPCDECDLEKHCEHINWRDKKGNYLVRCKEGIWRKEIKNFFQEIRAYKSREDMFAHNPLDLKFVVNQNPDYRERYEKEYARGVAAGLTVKYARPVVAVLTTIDGKTEVTEVHQARRCK